jgi:nucleotide-binding universal stress UspA family protein
MASTSRTGEHTPVDSATDVIVAGIDGSPAARIAADWAAFDAQRRGATLRLVHAVLAEPIGGYPEPILVGPKVSAAMRSRAQTLLQNTAELLAHGHPGLRIETMQRDGAPVKVLLDQSRRATVATVVGADGAGRLAGAFFGSVTARLAAHGHGCIVIARPGPADPAGQPGVVAVGVDGSVHSQAAIGFAYEEAALRGATLLAVHTWNDTPLDHALGNYPLEINRTGIDDQEHRLLETELAGWEQKYPDVPVRMRVLRGRPAPSLLRYATTTGNQPTQLLVVGSRGRGGFTGLLLGSTSQAVMIHAGCSVAIVHEQRGPGHLAATN